MLALNTRKLSTTLFISLAVLVAISTVVEANHDSPMHKRMVRKRSPQLGDDGLPGPVIGAAPIPGSSTLDPASVSSSSSASSSSVASSSASVSSASESVSSSSASESVSTSSSESSSVSSSSASASSTPAPAQITPPPQDEKPTGIASTQARSTKTLVKSVEASETAAPSMTGGAAQTQSNVVTILVAIAASIGGVFILWTIFRKWKLGSSKKFEERLQPIDWKNASHEDDGIVPPHRRHSGNSFHSATARTNGGLTPLPEHDFTAVPGSASPVGGYADMNRGPSPQPFMRENRPFDFNGRY